MKENETTEIENENKNILTLEKARELLGENDISDEKLEMIISNIKVFCKVAYEMYCEEQNKKMDNEQDTIIELHSNQELKEAA
ncbi:MAG: hypothetical protein HY062_02020 [Bacteroidetes bacterium]|nr:hypothetical protein [Bacteroidota bacterium]